MSDPSPHTELNFSIASNYIIALDGDDAGCFVVCQPVLVIPRTGNWHGLTTDEIMSYIRGRASVLHAAPLPGFPVRQSFLTSGPGHRP